MKPVYSILILLFFLGNCQEEEKLISGEIHGIVYTHNQDLSMCDDRSGVEVSLFQGSELVQSTFTSMQGQYVFEQIPYGRYRISLQKERFIQSRSSHNLYHIGGYSPTSATYHLHEIPTYSLFIDTIRYDNKNQELVLYMKVNGDTLPSSQYIYNYNFRAFFSNSPDVTRLNHVCQGKGYIYSVISEDPTALTVISQINTSEINNNFDQLKSDTLYLILYPLAQGQGYWIEDYYPEALGKPSNVFSFNWDDLVGGK